MVLLGTGRSIDGGCDNGCGARRQAPGAKGVRRRPRRRTRCWSAQQSAITRGDRGARHRHQTVRRVDLHVHLPGVRVGAFMKTYRRLYGEHLKRQRNERAPPIWCERSRVKESDRCSWEPVLDRSSGPPSGVVHGDPLCLVTVVDRQPDADRRHRSSRLALRASDLIATVRTTNEGRGVWASPRWSHVG